MTDTIKIIKKYPRSTHRRRLNEKDFEAIKSIQCTDEQDEKIKKKILKIGNNSKLAKQKFEQFSVFVEKYKNQLNENQIESLEYIIDIIGYTFSLGYKFYNYY